MIENDYQPNEERINVRRIGQFGKPDPENYLRIQSAKDAHPAGKKPKAQKKLDPSEAVNLFRLVLIFIGSVVCSVGVALQLTLALGLIVFGLLMLVIGVRFINPGTTEDTADTDTE